MHKKWVVCMTFFFIECFTDINFPSIIQSFPLDMWFMWMCSCWLSLLGFLPIFTPCTFSHTLPLATVKWGALNSAEVSAITHSQNSPSLQLLSSVPRDVYSSWSTSCES